LVESPRALYFFDSARFSRKIGGSAPFDGILTIVGGGSGDLPAKQRQLNRKQHEQRGLCSIASSPA
jgi:hypothetical protein